MKECDNSKIHISSNFILFISLLIMFDTLLLRPSLHCNTPLHFTTFQPTTLHYARHSTVLISKLISKIMNPFTALKNFSPFHFTSLFILFFHLSYQPYTSLYYSYLQLASLHLTSLHCLLFIVFTSPH